MMGGNVMIEGFIIKNAKVKIISHGDYDGVDIKFPNTKEIFKTVDEVLDYIDSSEELYDTGWGIPFRLNDYFVDESKGYVILRKSSVDGDITVSFQMVLPQHIMTLDELDTIKYLFK
jgi:hypothetical protein